MHRKFLSILCCPETGEPLDLVVNEETENGIIFSGLLVSLSGHQYPIVRGIPRFVDTERYAASFGYEWTRWPRLQFEDENFGKPMQGHTARMWNITVAPDHQVLKQKTIVEFGCGPGRFLDQVRKKEGIAVGLDISNAVEVARINFKNDPDVLIVQGDILNPPFRENSFDGGYSIGVFHHTPDPAKCVESLVTTVKKDGWVAVTVYPQGEFYDYPSVARFRRLHNRIKKYVGYMPALAYSYFSAYFINPMLGILYKIPGSSRIIRYFEREWLVILNLKDPRWSVLDIFDAITPSIATTHSEQELATWLAKSGCGSLQTTSWCKTSMIGIKEVG